MSITQERKVELIKEFGKFLCTITYCIFGLISKQQMMVNIVQFNMKLKMSTNLGSIRICWHCDHISKLAT